MALGLAEAGADVAVVSRTKEALESVAEEIRALGRRGLVVRADVTDRDEGTDMVRRTMEAFGRIDILVNNAGTIFRAAAEEHPEEEWDRVMAVNLKGVFLCCQAVGKVMIAQRRGKIINIGSLLSEIGVPLIPAYSASKGGVRQLTKALAVEWAQYNVHVNAIGPGYFRTELTDALQKDEVRAAWILSRTPLGRWGVPEDLKGPVVFLASDASDFITGQMLYVDGGWLAG
jgi:NAD(P)-dependent dehydrogenase (short-subunit alcohol dehydrogenase family)